MTDEELRSLFVNLNTQLELVNERFDEVKSRIDNVNGRLDRMGRRLERVEADAKLSCQQSQKVASRLSTLKLVVQESEPAAAVPAKRSPSPAPAKQSPSKPNSRPTAPR